MMQTAFDAEDWIDRLATSLPRLAKSQEPYLEHYCRHYPRTRRIVDGRDVMPFPLDDVRMVDTIVRYNWRLGEETQYAPLRKPLDPVSHALLAHPTLQRVAVAGRPIGDNDSWMGIINSGSSISAGDMIAGLMAWVTWTISRTLCSPSSSPPSSRCRGHASAAIRSSTGSIPVWSAR